MSDVEATYAQHGTPGPAPPGAPPGAGRVVLRDAASVRVRTLTLLPQGAPSPALLCTTHVLLWACCARLPLSLVAAQSSLLSAARVRSEDTPRNVIGDLYRYTAVRCGGDVVASQQKLLCEAARDTGLQAAVGTHESAGLSWYLVRSRRQPGHLGL